MRLSFVLPQYFDFPIGGYRVHFEHANRLAARGHKVTIYLPLRKGRISNAWTLFRIIVLARHIQGKDNCGLGWFKFTGPKVRIIPDYRTCWFSGEGDAIIATAWQTAALVARLPKRLGLKFYSIWDYEHYMSSDEIERSCIAATYRLGLNHIASTKAINNLVISLGGKSAYIVDTGIDFKKFFVSEPLDSVRRKRIGFSARDESFKRTDDAINALREVRESHPDVEVWSFGGKRLSSLPDWVSYYERPTDESLASLYNESAIFVCSSHYEGWGLPGSEAMACGVALVSTDHGGVNAYAVDRDNALIVPPCDSHALASSVKALLDDEPLRQSIARRGATSIQRFDWESSTTKLENALTDAHSRQNETTL